MRRTIWLSLAAALGLSCAGGIVGTLTGLIAPGFFRRVFELGSAEPINAVEIGLGAGTLVGFLTAVVVVAIVLAAGMVISLFRQRMFVGSSLKPTVGGLIVVVAVAALGSASLKNPSRAAVELWFSVTALSLAVATLVAFCQTASRREFAAGFAIFGWSYMLLSLHSESRAQLPTSQLLPLLEEHISGSWQSSVHVLSLEMGPFPARQRGAAWEPIVTSRGGIPGTLNIDDAQPEFRRIGHCLFALVAAITGGILGDFLRSRRSRGLDSP
jgi:hypothetical protein